MTIKNRYLLPLISELMDKLRGAKYFSKLMFNRATTMYASRLAMSESSLQNQPRFIRTYSNVLWLTNSPATFQ